MCVFDYVDSRAGLKQRPHDGVPTAALGHTAANDVYRLTKEFNAVYNIFFFNDTATTEIYTADVDMDELREAMEGRPYGRAA